MTQESGRCTLRSDLPQGLGTRSQPGWHIHLEEETIEMRTVAPLPELDSLADQYGQARLIG